VRWDWRTISAMDTAQIAVAAPPTMPTPPTTRATDPPPSDRSLLRRWFGPLATGATWRSTVHLLLDLPLGVLFFTAVVTLLSLGLGMLITIIGLPILVLTIVGGRLIGAFERRRAAALLEVDLPGFAPFDRSGSLWLQTKRGLMDGPGWRGLGYGLLLLPWGTLVFSIVVTLWSATAFFVTYPMWFWILPDDEVSGPFQFGDYAIDGTASRAGVIAGAFVLGVLLLAVTPRIVRLLASADRGLIRSLLSPDPTTVLTERVEQLTASREASVESAAQELRRIERDLHDGAQQRLVALAMDLGMAKERLADGSDPAAAEMVTRAHEEAKQAIAELRDLVRGIHPQILSDRGLDAALSALVARSSIPVSVDVSLGHRPPTAIEATAYFVVAEALANMAKHSGATRGSVRVEQVGPLLLIDVRDDGRGGAVEVPGGGLAGLRDRVRAVDGTLRVTSPNGGPTELHVELPCGS
jgi:signal transduction histidine kinase